MKLAIAQIDTLAADVRGNAGRLLEAVDRARGLGADTVIFPELALVGYAPYDLLLRPEVLAQAEEALAVIAAETADLTVILGTIAAGTTVGGRPRNVAAVLDGGRVVGSQAKTLLPAYDVFHDPRYFEPAGGRNIVEVRGRRLGLLICEDMWDEGYPLHPAAELRRQGAELLVVLSASPYRQGVLDRRLHHARRHGLPLVYVNGAGASDELVFDGRSFVVDGAGTLKAALPGFRSAIQRVDVAGPGEAAFPDVPIAAELFAAMVSGVRGFVAKNGLATVTLGLSGGVDSALAACVAARALGPERVLALALPGRYTDPRSTGAAAELAESLGIGFEVVSIGRLHEAAEKTLGPILADPDPAAALARENVQARLRMVVLMARVNRHGGLLLNTSNKTELSLGYGTLYGDLAGGLAPLGDLTKPEVYAVCRWLGASGTARIPPFILERAPTAELAADQVDPFDYPRLAPLAEAVATGADTSRLLELGASPTEIGELRRRLHRSEHKRWQGPVVVKLKEQSFGRGRLMPVTHGFANAW